MGKSQIGFEIKEVTPQVHRAATIFTLMVDHPEPGDILEALGVYGEEVYAKQPKLCPICRSRTISTLEIVGISSKPVFWECEDCGVLLCACDRGWICSRIKKLYNCWTVSSHWAERPKRQDYI